jgi:Ca2+/H+ antiporter, TMEM165/GDT1 family
MNERKKDTRARNMKRNRVGKVLTVVAFATLFATAFGYIVMRLWNWLMPGLFGLHVIGFWQAVGLLVLSKILFGGFHGRHGGHMQWRHRMRERWGHMTPEEREKFRDTVRSRWGSYDPPATAPKV